MNDISSFLHGRTMLYTDETNIDKTNLISVMNEVLPFHEKNRNEMQYLLNYEKGIQPINSREKEIRPEINVRVAENHASEITEFKLGYEFGAPVTLVQRGNKDIRKSNSEKDDLRIAAFNEMMFEQGKPSKDARLARGFKVGGIGYKYIRPKRQVLGVSPFDILIPNPLNTFVVYTNDAYREPVLAVTYSVKNNGSFQYGCYTKDYYMEYNSASTESITQTPNIPGKIPIIEYCNNHDRMGCFEKVIPIMDALNVSTSDRINDLAQHVQNLLWGDNVALDPEKYKELREQGVIVTTSEQGRQATLKYLESVLNQSEVQTLTDYLYEQILQISGTPGREQSSGGNTGSAILLSNGWQIAETQAKTTELLFIESELQALDVALEIVKISQDVDDEIKSLNMSDVYPKFSRNRTYDLVSRTSAMNNMVSMGIDPNKAITVVDIFDDSQQVAVDSRERIDKILFGNEEKEKKRAVQKPVEPQPSAVPNVEK